ncbi:MAG: NAD-dependent epimerase/dehydratase family protein [Elusimicrobia bacterium]|nr:NAD-dependent epimerase/dehydratase family protein [Elusimicrobiota bacterium]
MRSLVTGAAGFVGSNLALALAAAGHEVVGLDDFTSGNFANLRGFAGDFVAADLSDPAAWADRVGDVEAVFHQAAITDTTVTDQGRMMRANVEAFRLLLRWAAERDIRTVVYASSAGIYGDGPVPMRETAASRPLNVYAFSKRVMEKVAADFVNAHPKMRVVGLRYFNVFGPRERFKGAVASMICQLALQMRAGKRPRIFTDGEQYRDHIYVKDVVRANLLAAQKAPSGAYNVCTGKKTTFNEIIRFLNAALGTGLEPEYFKNPYSFYQNETLGDPALAQKTFGYKAEFSVEKGVQDYLGAAEAPARI